MERMESSKNTLAGRRSLLQRVEGRIVFAFVHGSSATDNSRPDDRMCGLTNGISSLRDAWLLRRFKDAVRAFATAGPADQQRILAVRRSCPAQISRYRPACVRW